MVILIGLAGPIATLAQSGNLSAEDGGSPKPAVDLTPGTASYKVRLETGGRIITMDLTRTVKTQNGAWLVNETNTMPGLTTTDEAIVEKRTLLLRRRTIHEGTTSAEVQFLGNRATGTITVNGQKRDINTDVGGVLFADGPGGQDAIAALPLAQGYTANFRNFDVEQQQVKVRQLRVMGTDTVTVPAGTFHTWKLLVTTEGGDEEMTAYWVDKASRRVVKMATSLPEQNGALATAELIK
jgi:hypothetical protein